MSNPKWLDKKWTLIFFIYLFFLNEHLFCNNNNPFWNNDLHWLFHSGGRIIRVSGQNLDVVQEPKMRVILSPPESLPPRRKRRQIFDVARHIHVNQLKRQRRIVTDADCLDGTPCHIKQVNLYDATEIKFYSFCYRFVLCKQKQERDDNDISVFYCLFSSMSLSAVWRAPALLPALHRQWVQRPGGQRSKFFSLWIASILTSLQWGLMSSTMNPTQNFTHWIAITLPNHITTNQAASSLWRLVFSLKLNLPKNKNTPESEVQDS